MELKTEAVIESLIKANAGHSGALNHLNGALLPLLSEHGRDQSHPAISNEAWSKAMAHLENAMREYGEALEELKKAQTELKGDEVGNRGSGRGHF
ncbi:MAG: hypothetical protein AAF530_24510 [Pseudomonadota bacterium]